MTITDIAINWLESKTCSTCKYFKSSINRVLLCNRDEKYCQEKQTCEDWEKLLSNKIIIASKESLKNLHYSRIGEFKVYEDNSLTGNQWYFVDTK